MASGRYFSLFHSTHLHHYWYHAHVAAWTLIRHSVHGLSQCTMRFESTTIVPAKRMLKHCKMSWCGSGPAENAFLSDMHLFSDASRCMLTPHEKPHIVSLRNIRTLELFTFDKACSIVQEVWTPQLLHISFGRSSKALPAISGTMPCRNIFKAKHS